MPSASAMDTAAIEAALSTPRMSTYLAATNRDVDRALELYGWNARISAALMLPAHFAEVTTRNAVSEALTTVYGDRWPWSEVFEISLPTPPRVYNPRRNLKDVRRQQTSTGKVIAEMKFVFWQTMFTARHDDRVWDAQILSLFPNATELTPVDLRARIYADLESVRQLRNRVAHHEPVFTRDLAADLSKMIDLIELRSAATATWVRGMQEASAVLAVRP